MKIKYLSFGSEFNYQSILQDIMKSFPRRDTLQKPEKNATIQQKNDYHLEKINLEKDWMNHLVDKTVMLIDQKVEEVMKHSLDQSSLYIFMLPELWMHVPENLGKDIVTSKPTDYIRPFMNTVVRGMLESSAYHTLTKKYENLLLCPGSVWWKDIQQKASEFQEVYFRSAPVFYQGKCITFWDKQTLSDKDGAGPVNEMGSKVMKWMDYRKDVLKLKNVVDAGEMMEKIQSYVTENKPIRSSISESYQQMASTNVFTISIGKQTLSCSIEVCMDCVYKITQATKVVEPDLQLITSFELGFIPDEMCYAKSHVLWCDGAYGSFVYHKENNIFEEKKPDPQTGVSLFELELKNV